MKTVIVGLGRCGTTYLFSVIKDALGDNFITKFEPTTIMNLSTDNILCKVNPMYGRRFMDIFRKYDKKIHIVRDMRDQLVSYAMCLCYQTWENERQSLDKVIDLLGKKEEDCQSVSLLQIFDAMGNICPLNIVDKIHNHAKMQQSFQQDFNFFLVKYEDIISGVDDLSDYLGFELDYAVGVSSEYQFVVRAKIANGWRKWFTSEDVAVFEPILQKNLQYFDYGEDWELTSGSIDTQHASSYIKRIVNDRRVMSSLTPIFNTQEYIT